MKRQPFSEAEPGLMSSWFSGQSPQSTPPPCVSADIPLGRFGDSAHPQQQASPRHHQTAHCPNPTDVSGGSDKPLGQLHTTPCHRFLKHSMSLRPHNDGVCETAGIGFTLFHSVTFIDTYLGFHMSCRFQFNWLKKKKKSGKTRRDKTFLS